MFKRTIILATLATVSLGMMTTSAHAIALLVPAVQKARAAAAMNNADTDGDGIPDAYVWFGNVQNADGDVTPVLMVISNQDFYYQEYGDTRSTGEGDEMMLVARGPAFIGRLDKRDRDGKYVGAICNGVSVLAWARVDGESRPQPFVIISAGADQPLLLALQLMF